MSPSLPLLGLLVAAPPTLLRHGLLLTLREAWPERPTTLATDPTQLLARLQERAYALLIVDSAAFASALLPELLHQARRLRTGLPLLVLTGRRLPVLPLAPAGVAPLRLLPQHATPTQVAAAAAELVRAAPLHAPAHPPARPAASVGFSPRELEVLALVVADHCNQEIADHLCLSVRTVESHRRTLLHKAGARTLVGLAVRAVREGWVSA